MRIQLTLSLCCIFQADVEPEVAAGVPKKRTFKKFSFRGVDLDSLLDMSTDDLVKLLSARARRRYKYYSFSTFQFPVALLWRLVLELELGLFFFVFYVA